MANICVSVVCLNGETQPVEVKDPPRKTDKVLSALMRSYGEGVLTDGDGYLVIDDDLQAGYYRYTLRPPAQGHDDRSTDVVAMLKESFSEMARSVSNEIANTVSKGIVLALKPLTAQLRRTPSIAQSEITPRVESFKKELVQSYMDVEGQVAEIPCYVTGLLLPSFEVIAGHIFPMRAHTFISDFIPDIVSINDTRNGILWAAPIEQAFELSLMCFEWDEISHTLMPIVLDKNLMGKNLLEGMRYMKQIASGSTNIVEEDLGRECVQAATPTEVAECGNITSAEVKMKLQDIMAGVKSMNLSAKKSEQLRHKELERVFRSYIDGLYKNVFFERLHLQRKQFPVQVKMSGRAFKVTAILAFQEAKRRGVLPIDLAFDPQEDQTHYDPIDVYLTNDATVAARQIVGQLNVINMHKTQAPRKCESQLFTREPVQAKSGHDRGRRGCGRGGPTNRRGRWKGSPPAQMRWIPKADKV